MSEHMPKGNKHIGADADVGTKYGAGDQFGDDYSADVGTKSCQLATFGNDGVDVDPKCDVDDAFGNDDGGGDVDTKLPHGRKFGNDALGFIRVRKRTLKPHRWTGAARSSASFDLVKAIRVDGKPRHKFILGLGSQKHPVTGRLAAEFLLRAIGRMRRHAGILVLLVLFVATAGINRWDTDPLAAVLFGALFGVSALLFWLIGRACHYVLGGDASALWERALLARARRSATFRNSFAVIALIGIGMLGYGVWSKQVRDRMATPQATPSTTAPPPAAAITAADLSLTDVTLGYLNDNYGLHGTITNNSKRPLASLIFQVTMEDCPSGLKLPSGWTEIPPSSTCRIVGKEQTTADADVPGGQARTFDAPLTFAHMPPVDPKRPRTWTWKIVSVKEAFDPCAEGDESGTCSPVTKVDGE